MNKKTIIGAITFPISGQTLILGIGAILFASRSLSRTNTSTETNASQENDETVVKLTQAVIDKLRRKEERKRKRSNKYKLELNKMSSST